MNTDNKFKIYLITLATLCALYIATISSLFVLDPLQIFDKAPFSKNTFSSDIRKQAAGIINSYEFDSLIVGSSMLENTSPSEAGIILDGSFANLSMSGSLLSERALFINHALRRGKIKNIISSLDGFGKVGEFNPKRPISDFNFLYNTNNYDDFMIYTNPRYIVEAACQILRNKIDYCNKRYKSIEMITEWYSDPQHSARFGGLNKWFENDNNSQIIAALKDISSQTKCIKDKSCQAAVTTTYDHMEESFTEYLLTPASTSPATHFHLVFPPYSRVKYALWYYADHLTFNRYIQSIRTAVTLSSSTPNLSIYGFDDLPFLDEIKNYKDTGHYRPKMNSIILQSIGSKSNVLTAENVDQYIKTITKLARDYDIVKVGDMISDYLLN